MIIEYTIKYHFYGDKFCMLFEIIRKIDFWINFENKLKSSEMTDVCMFKYLIFSNVRLKISIAYYFLYTISLDFFFSFYSISYIILYIIFMQIHIFKNIYFFILYILYTISHLKISYKYKENRSLHNCDVVEHTLVCLVILYIKINRIQRIKFFTNFREIQVWKFLSMLELTNIELYKRKLTIDHILCLKISQKYWIKFLHPRNFNLKLYQVYVYEANS